jgi:hypothetical protein
MSRDGCRREEEGRKARTIEGTPFRSSPLTMNMSLQDTLTPDYIAEELDLSQGSPTSRDSPKFRTETRLSEVSTVPFLAPLLSTIKLTNDPVSLVVSSCTQDPV